jgi:hypothetical protein
LEKLLEARPLLGAYHDRLRDRRARYLQTLVIFRGLQLVSLVESIDQGWTMPILEYIVEHLHDRAPVVKDVRARDIQDVEQEIGVARRLQRRRERRDELVREFLNKPNGVRDDHELPVGEEELRVSGSNVAKSLSSMNVSAPVKARKSVDLPVLV